MNRMNNIIRIKEPVKRRTMTGMISWIVLTEDSHPFAKADPVPHSVVRLSPATPASKAGNELPTLFPRAVRQRYPLTVWRSSLGMGCEPAATLGKGTDARSTLGPTLQRCIRCKVKTTVPFLEIQTPVGTRLQTTLSA